MHALDEWEILVNGAKRRRLVGTGTIEDEALLDIDKVLRYTLGEGCEHKTHKRCFTAILEMIEKGRAKPQPQAAPN